MAFTQTQLDALDAAIAQGTFSVQYGNKMVTYKSLDEMLRIRALMYNSLHPNATNSAARGRQYGEFSKGLQ